MAKSKVIKEYINSIKREFPVLNKEEKQYLKQLEEQLILKPDNITISQLNEEVGFPLEVIQSYYDDRGDIIPNKAKFSTKFILTICTLLILIALISSIIGNYNEGKKSYIDREQTTLEDSTYENQ